MPVACMHTCINFLNFARRKGWRCRLGGRLEWPALGDSPLPMGQPVKLTAKWPLRSWLLFARRHTAASLQCSAGRRSVMTIGQLPKSLNNTSVFIIGIWDFITRCYLVHCWLQNYALMMHHWLERDGWSGNEHMSMTSAFIACIVRPTGSANCFLFLLLDGT